MNTVEENIALLKKTKEAIKVAIETKGIIVGDILFEDYPEKIASIQGGSISQNSVDDYLESNGLSYLKTILINEISRSIELNKTASDITDAFLSQKTGAIYTKGSLPVPETVKMDYQKAIVSIRGCDFRNLKSLNLRACVNLYEFSGISTEASGENITDLSNVTVISNAFADCASLKSISIYVPKCTSFDNTFGGCFNLENAYARVDNTKDNAININYMFSGCRNLKLINVGDNLSSNSIQGFVPDCVNLKKIIGIIEVINVSSFSRSFDNCPSLEEVWIKGLNADGLSIYCPLLKKECILYLFNNAMQQSTTKRIYLHKDSVAKLSSDDISIATNKGFTLIY